MHLSNLIPAIDRKVRTRLYHPEDILPLPCQHDDVHFEAVRLETEDHAAITGLTTDAPPNARCCIVFLHGNGGCAASRAHLVAPFYKLGAQVIVADYRGYGGNVGQPSERGLLRDARAFYKHAVETFQLPVILIGHSLGGNLAIQLAAEADVTLAGLITVNAVASVSAYAASYIRPFISDRYDAIPKARDIQVPWTIAHDIGDPIVSLSHALILCQANFPNINMRLITLNNRHHEFPTLSISALLGEHLAFLGSN
jgi:pimeloyl-ACP methyl ester carboxylesterase